MTADPIAAEKAALRKVMRARRAALSPETRVAASIGLRDRLLAWIASTRHARDAVIAGYWPIRDELDPRPALQALAEREYRLALPVSITKGAPLAFRAWAPGDPLAFDIMCIEAPLLGAPAVTPRLILVPMLAFDRVCCRLGYGGGFYDRTLATLRATGAPIAVGLAFSAQKVERVPVAEGDAALDAVMTEDDFALPE